jgi:hypothetical protein
MLCRFLTAVILSALITPNALSFDHWIALRTPHFELLTECGEKEGRDSLRLFEEVRAAFTDTLGLRLPNARPVTIIAFLDEHGLAPYRPHPNALAFTTSIRNHNYVVMQDLNPAHYPVALHELTHVLIDQAGIKLPLWLNEGFGEFYGTLIPSGKGIRVGRSIPERMQVLQSAMLDLREVLNADKKSPLYREADRIGVFYAESWALLHMLKFSDSYGARFERFLDAVGTGQSSEAALQAVYGKTVDQIFRDLVLYVRGGKFREGVIKARLNRAVPEPQLEKVNPLSLSCVLASIEAQGPQRPLAITTLKELAGANPTELQPVETLAWAELSGPDPVQAIEPFRRALELGTRDAMLCFGIAAHLRAAISDDIYVSALRRTIEVDPAMDQAHELLAAYAFDHHDFRETVIQLRAIKKLEKSNAFTYYSMLADAAFQTGDLSEARSARSRAEAYASTTEQKRRLDELRRREDGK